MIFPGQGGSSFKKPWEGVLQVTSIFLLLLLHVDMIVIYSLQYTLYTCYHSPSIFPHLDIRSATTFIPTGSGSDLHGDSLTSAKLVRLFPGPSH